MMRSNTLPFIFSFVLSLYALTDVSCFSAPRMRVDASASRKAIFRKRGIQVAVTNDDDDDIHSEKHTPPKNSRNICSRRHSLKSFALVTISPLLSNPSASSAAGFPFGISERTSPDPFRYDLSKSNDFLKLPRERALSNAEKEIKSIQDLEDDRLRECEDRGEFWEQCFIYGMRDDEIKGTRGPVDYQMVAPEAALEPAKVGKGSKTQIPTW